LTSVDRVPSFADNPRCVAGDVRAERNYHRMKAETIEEYLNAKPFHRFRVRLPDGSTVNVLSRDHAALSPTGRTLAIFIGKSDRVKILDVPLITAIETKDPEAK
jgi:hypothetical protein